MSIALEETESGALVRLEGAVDIANAAELKMALVQALGAGRPVAVSLAAATYVDVTALQLLWAAERKARQAGVGFGVEGEIPGAVTAAILEAGFPQLPGLVEAA